MRNVKVCDPHRNIIMFRRVGEAVISTGDPPESDGE